MCIIKAPAPHVASSNRTKFFRSLRSIKHLAEAHYKRSTLAKDKKKRKRDARKSSSKSHLTPGATRCSSPFHSSALVSRPTLSTGLCNKPQAIPRTRRSGNSLSTARVCVRERAILDLARRRMCLRREGNEGDRARALAITSWSTYNYPQ